MKRMNVLLLLLLMNTLLIAQPPISCSQTCPEEDLSLAEVPIDTNYFCSANTIQVSGTLAIEQEATFRAGDRISFKPGFKAVAGSSLRAFTDDCDGLQGIENRSVTTPDFSFSIAPNPIFYEGTVQVILPESAEMSIQLSALNGRIIHTLVHRKLFEQGEYAFQVETTALPAGVYFATLHVYGNIHTKRILVAK